jgi:hypothetical protein
LACGEASPGTGHARTCRIWARRILVFAPQAVTRMNPSAAALAILIAVLTAQVDAGTIRSNSAKAEFKREHPCPATGARSGPCGGYVIDHVIPVACAGPDAPSNMQWQTIAEGKAKDRWEVKGCRR